MKEIKLTQNKVALGKKKHIGHFKSETEAAIAYNQAAVLYFGKDARLNEVLF